MRGRFLAMAALAALLVAGMGMVPAMADGGGGVFVDVDPSHPAFGAIRALVDRGIVVIGASGEFQGSQPLLRYDAAQWLYRTLERAQGAGSGDVDALAGRVSTVENRVSTVSNNVGRMESDLQSLKDTVGSLQRDVGNLRDVASPAENLSQRVQTNFVLGVTAVVLGVAALGVAIFFS